MQSLKLTLNETDLFIKQIKQQQQQQVKGIISVYKHYIQKDEPNYSNAYDRIQTNLKSKTQISLHDHVYNFDLNGAIQRFKKQQLSLIDKQIQQARVIINKGCGTVQKREFTNKTQKMENPIKQTVMMKTYSGQHHKVSKQTINFEQQKMNKAIIKIQRWWRKLNPQKPIYQHSDYFDD